MSLFTPAGAAVEHRRSWGVVLAFALVNLLAWVVYHQLFGAAHMAVLHVESFDPGAGTLVSNRPTLTWRFNLDLAHRLGEASDLGSIKPVVAGKWEVADARTLRFTPDDDLPKATPFAVTLANDRLRSTAGFALDTPFSVTVQTSPLQLLSARQIGMDVRHRLTLELAFDDRVIPADVANHLKICTADGKTIGCRLLGEAVGKMVRVVTDPVQLVDDPKQTTTVLVDVLQGLAGVSGPLPLPNAMEAKVEVGAQLTAVEVSGETSARLQPALTVRFNNAVKADELEGVFSVDPNVSFRLASENDDSVRLIGDFEPGTRYTLRVAAGLPQTRPSSDDDTRQMPRPATFSVLFPDRDPSNWFEHDSGYLGAKGNRTVLAHVCNEFELLITATRVYDSNLVLWRNHHDRWSGDVAEYARPIASRRIQLPREKNKVQDLPICLDDILPAAAPRDGVYRLAIIEQTGKPPVDRSAADEQESQPDSREDYDSANATVTLSDIGLSAKRAQDELLVWAVSLSSGKPLAGVRVRVFSSKNQVLAEAGTSLDGLAHFAAIETAPGETASVIIADTDSGKSNLTWLDLSDNELDMGPFDVAGRNFLRKGYEAFVYTDRGVYRPGEMVHLRAIVRGRDNATPRAFPVQWQLRKPDLRDWKTAMATLDADGAAGLDLQLPTDLPTGRWTAEIGFPAEPNAKSRQVFGTASFQIEEYVPNRMRVSVALPLQPGGNRVLALANQPLFAEVQADYLFGKAVTQRPARMAVRAAPAMFASPQWQGWTFGDTAEAMPILLGKHAVGARIDLSAAALDAKGHARLQIPREQIFTCDAVDDGEKQPESKDQSKDNIEPFMGPWRVTLAASVTETGGRAVTAVQTADVDCVPVYVGIQFDADQVKPRVPVECKIRLVRPDGQQSDQNQEVEAALYRQTWNNSLVDDGHGHFHFQSTCKLAKQDMIAGEAAIQQGGGQLSFTAPGAGNYVLYVRDPATGFVSTRSFIATIDAWDDNISRENPEKIDVLVRPAPPLPPGAMVLPADFSVSSFLAAARDTLWNLAIGQHAPDRSKPSRLRVGDDAEVIISSPFAGRLLLTVETDRIIRTQVIDMPASQMSLRLPITADCRPNAYVTATVIRKVDPAAKWVAHRAYGVARLAVDNTDRQLHVELATPGDTRPAQPMVVNLRVMDEMGEPVPQAAVTVAAVDEGICQLTDFTTPNPCKYFHAFAALGVKWFDFYDDLMPEVDKPRPQSAIGGDGGDDAAMHSTPVTARRVKSMALFSGVVHTDSTGVAHADFEIPEFFGQVRVMAVAYAGRKFGAGDTDVYVRSPLLVQSSWPRFAAPGDKWSVPLTVVNNSASADEVKISVELPPDAAGNPLAFASGNARVLDLPPMHVGTQATVWVDVAAGPASGVGHAIIRATMGGETSTEHVELPIRPASPAVTLGGYVDARPNAPAVLKLPTGMMPGAGELEICCQSSDSLEIPRGLEYLDRYPYGCLEQTTSTLFPLVYLDAIGKRIAPGVFQRAAIADKVQAGVLRMLSMQNADGGLAMWPEGRENWDWGSIYAAHFVVTAAQAGYAIPDDFRDNLLHYVRTRLNRGGDDTDTLEQNAYACYVLALAGKPDVPSMNRLAEQIKWSDGGSAADLRPAISAPTRYQLAMACLAAGRHDLAEALIPATLPLPRKQRQQDGNVGSEIRDRAMLIETLITVQPDHPQLPALVRQLAESAPLNRWNSTQDVAFAVMALGHWIKIAPPEKPYQSAQLVLGDATAVNSASETLFWAASARPPEANRHPTTMPSEAVLANVKLAITGPADAVGHVSWLFTGVPLQPPANADHGMKIRREYRNADGAAVGDHALHSGELVQVVLTIESTTPLENVVIDDLLPAGLEIENPDLASSADADVSVHVEPTRRHRLTTFYRHHLRPFGDDTVADGNVAAVPTFNTHRRQVRDDRMVLMGELSMTGSAEISYLARAVTPGTFVVPPVQAECMYDNGINSIYRGGTTLVVLPVAADAVAKK